MQSFANVLLAGFQSMSKMISKLCHTVLWMFTQSPIFVWIFFFFFWWGCLSVSVRTWCYNKCSTFRLRLSQPCIIRWGDINGNVSRTGLDCGMCHSQSGASISGWQPIRSWHFRSLRDHWTPRRGHFWRDHELFAPGDLCFLFSIHKLLFFSVLE